MNDQAPVVYRAYIGLGSNLDNPENQIHQALKELAGLPDSHLTATSSLYRSRPVGPPQPDYINAVARLDTRLEPLALLDQLQALEQAHQRVRKEHWGPRTLDLDILLYGVERVDHPRLQVPHPWMHERSFVLYPLAQLEPHLVMPDGQLLSDLLACCPPDGLIRIHD